jgi:thiol-disulfide isomerase/thioredoxin
MSLIMVIVLVVGAIVGAALASGEKGSDDVGEQLKALQERVASLEKEIQTLKQNLPPSQEMEREAATAFRQIDALIQKGDTEKAKTELTSFMAKYGRTQAGRQAQRLQQELSVVGKASPADWGITKWFQGESDINLDGSGTTLVVFWETWCPHCQREVPKLEKIYADFQPKGLQVIGVTKVTRSATDDKVSQFITDKKVSYPIAKEDGALTRYFNVAGIPAAAVVKDGKVVWRGHPSRLSSAMLEGWM